MNVEISKIQKESISQKLALCVEFLKQHVQPHLMRNEKREIDVCDDLVLCVSADKLYVKCIRFINLGFCFEFSRILYLDKSKGSNAKKFICDVSPELAVAFLQNWDKTKNELSKLVAEKIKETDSLNQLIDNFKL